MNLPGLYMRASNRVLLPAASVIMKAVFMLWTTQSFRGYTLNYDTSMLRSMLILSTSRSVDRRLLCVWFNHVTGGCPRIIMISNTCNVCNSERAISHDTISTITNWGRFQSIPVSCNLSSSQPLRAPLLSWAINRSVARLNVVNPTCAPFQLKAHPGTCSAFARMHNWRRECVVLYHIFMQESMYTTVTCWSYCSVCTHPIFSAIDWFNMGACRSRSIACGCMVHERRWHCQVRSIS